ncbi:MAG: DUF4339 domain-containing protein [Armatimonadota bacterium]|nr:DUF4339 domain-containing protein [Armatimonadota bacterium]
MDLAACGVISGDTFVWAEGMPEWKRAGEIEDFRLKVPAPAPPPAPFPPRPVSPVYHQPMHRDFAYLVPAKPKSPLSRTAAGVLNIFVPGVGRMYLGHVTIGIVQLVATVCSFGVLYVWPFVDGILMLTGSVTEDGMGRQLDS